MIVSLILGPLRRVVLLSYGGSRLVSKVGLALFFSVNMAAAKDLTLLAFGDSLTQGYGLEQGQGFVPQLEAWLVQAGVEVKVVNGGVSGDTTAGAAARIDWSLTSDVDAVIVALGGNDALRGLPVVAAQENLAFILERVQTKGLPVLLVGIHAPGNFGAGYQAEFDAAFQTLAATYDVPLFESFLQGIEDIADRNLVLRDFLQADALHPNSDGVALIVERMGPSVLKLFETKD